MKFKSRDFIIGIIIIITVVGLFIWQINRERNVERRELASRIRELSPTGGIPRNDDDLLKAIKLYEAQIEINIRDGVQTGTYWKILARRFADKGMHLLALEALDNAKRFNAEDPALYCWEGESALAVARSITGYTRENIDEKVKFYNRAEIAFNRSIELDRDYANPRIGLGTMLTIDLDRPSEAISHLERFLQINTTDINGMFVLAQAYYVTANSEGTSASRAFELNQRAIELYDRIISRSNNPQVIQEAEKNKNIVRNY